MPILAEEPSLYPEGLMTAGWATSQPSQHHWRVLHTKPRQEKALARELWRRGQPFYLPLAQRRQRVAGRWMTSRLPLFNGYLFIYSDSDGYHQTLTTQRVVRGLAVTDQARLWADLKRLHDLLASGLPVLPEERLTPGQLVEITSGPLTGFQGRILRTSSGRRFVVEVDFIGRGASVLCEGMTLRAVKDLR
jgi:transcriptional antiterminator RfaH